jgi:DNA repair photolyase
VFYTARVRWENLQLGNQPDSLFPELSPVREVRTPEFRDITFLEIVARSIINRVPEASRVPFRWTINPYRGCTHACVYCFARNTHTYLDLDAGEDFNRMIVVKTNAVELLRKELASPRWTHEHIAMGTNVDCYQRAEGRYRLMRGIIAALRENRNPFSILTKGTLILRDLDLLMDAAAVTDVSTNVSVGFVDPDAWRTLEPGTPAPRRRLAVCRTLNEHGIRCGVLMAPIVPYLTDGPEQLERTVRAIAASGATHLSPIVLHLRPGAREWFMARLQQTHPQLVQPIRELYHGGSYAPKAYQSEVVGRVHELARRHGVGAGAGRRPAVGQPDPVRAEPNNSRPAATIPSSASAAAP